MTKYCFNSILFVLFSMFVSGNSATAHTLSGTIFGGSDPLENVVVTLLDNGTQSILDTDTMCWSTDFRVNPSGRLNPLISITCDIL